MRTRIQQPIGRNISFLYYFYFTILLNDGSAQEQYILERMSKMLCVEVIQGQ